MEHEGDFPGCYQTEDLAQARCYCSDVKTEVIGVGLLFGWGVTNIYVQLCTTYLEGLLKPKAQSDMNMFTEQGLSSWCK